MLFLVKTELILLQSPNTISEAKDFKESVRLPPSKHVEFSGFYMRNRNIFEDLSYCIRSFHKVE